jgi:carbonic anhydrase
VSTGDEVLGEALTYDRIIWLHDGSLTTPPCSEAVKWLVMRTPVEVSGEQIAAYTAIFSGNARPTQPLHGREFIVGQLPPMLPTTGAPASALPAAAIVVAGVLVALGAISRRCID